jgi:hypothetical protein
MTQLHGVGWLVCWLVWIKLGLIVLGCLFGGLLNELHDICGSHCSEYEVNL